MFMNNGESLAFDSSFAYVGLAAIFGSASYYYYYRALVTIGPSRAMALNISYTASSTLFSYFFFDKLFGDIFPFKDELGDFVRG